MNKITFKDVAHMYMGCEVQFEAFEKDEETGEVIRRWTETGRFEHYNFGAMLARGAKPVLRRPDDVTEFDEMEAVSNKYPHLHGFTDSDMIADALAIWVLTREGFDCFGLIDNGEAIDAATLGEEVQP